MTKILSLLLLLITAPSVNQAASEKVTAEEYSVYSSLINSRFLTRGTNLAVIQARTEFDITSVPIPKEFEDDLLPKIDKAHTLAGRLRIRGKYLLLTPAQLDRLFKRHPGNAWDLYWKTYPHATGLLTFSRVSFNPERTRAFLYVAETCGPRCGHGYTFVLEKRTGAWRIVNEKQLWIA